MAERLDQHLIKTRSNTMERDMFTKIRNAMFALAAIAALGTATLITTTDSADARGFGGGGSFSRGAGGGHVGGMRMGGGRNFGGGRVHLGGRIGINRFGRGQFGHHHVRHHNWCRFNHRCHFNVRWHRPWIYGVGAVAATSYAVSPAAVAAAPRCTCLTKEYTQDGLVVFQDVCTKEVASAPIGNTQAQLPLPQQQEQAPQ
jgi:hypothetical protein